MLRLRRRSASPRTCSGFIGLGPTAARVWNVARWPAAVLVAMLVFALRLLRHARRRAALVPLGHARARSSACCSGSRASVGFSAYLTRVANVGAAYGAFAGAIVLVAWLWLTNVALLFGAELNAEIERQKELGEGVPERETLNRPVRPA